MEISVKQMMAIENNGHDMGFLKKFMMENAGAAAVKRLVERFGDVSSKKILVYAGLGNNGGDAMVVYHLIQYICCFLNSKFYLNTLRLAYVISNSFMGCSGSCIRQ